MNIESTIEICANEEAKTIVDALNKYNFDKVPPTFSELWIPLDFVAKDKNKEVIGGLLAGIGYWGGLEIKILWVREDYRGKGLGTKLLRKVEDIAISKGTTVSFLDTFDFHAEEFYVKNGYSVFGVLENFPKGHKRIYLSKKLTDKN